MAEKRILVNLDAIPALGTLINDKMCEVAARNADELYRRQSKTQWATQGESTGVRWKNLTKKYRRYKGREQRSMRAAGRVSKLFRPVSDLQGPKIVASSTDVLVLHGNLRRAFSYRNELHIAEGRIIDGIATFAFGARGAEKYWNYHRKGSGNNPKRDFTQRTDTQVKEIVHSIRNTILAMSKIESARLKARRGSRA